MQKKTIIYIIIGVLFVVGTIFWLHIQTNKSSQKALQQSGEIGVEQTQEETSNPEETQVETSEIPSVFSKYQFSKIDTSNWENYSNDTLGISFKYPPEWGEIKVDEKVEVGSWIEGCRAGKDFCDQKIINSIEKYQISLENFLALSDQEQIDFLTKNNLENLLNKNLVLIFANNPKIKIEAVNKEQMPYEELNERHPIYRGNNSIDIKLCENKTIQDIALFNLYHSKDCEIINTTSKLNIATALGAYVSNTVTQDNEKNVNFYLTSILNAPLTTSYDGIVIDYLLNSYSTNDIPELNLLSYTGFNYPQIIKEKSNYPLILTPCYNAGKLGKVDLDQFEGKEINDDLINSILSVFNDAILENVSSLDSQEKESFLVTIRSNLEKFKGQTFDRQEGYGENMVEGPYLKFIHELTLTNKDFIPSYDFLRENYDFTQITFPDITYAFCQIGYSNLYQNFSDDISKQEFNQVFNFLDNIQSKK